MNDYYAQRNMRDEYSEPRRNYDMVEANKYQQYVTYQMATTEINESTQKVLDKLDGDVELQAQYLKTIEEKQKQEEEEKKQKEIFDEVNKKHAERVKSINKFSIGIGVYLLLVFPVMYFFTNFIDLQLLNTVGAIGLTLFVSVILGIVILIRAFALQYQDIKSGIIQKQDLTIQGMSGIILLAAILLVLFI